MNKVMNIRTMVSPLLIQAIKISACKFIYPIPNCPSPREMADAVSGIEITEQTPVPMGIRNWILLCQTARLNDAMHVAWATPISAGEMLIGAIAHTERKIFNCRLSGGF